VCSSDLVALFAVDFGGIAWFARHTHPGPGPYLNAALVFFTFAPFVLLLVLIYLYVPPKLDDACYVILILIVLIALLVPALQHS